jgi:acetyl esterase/lipase
MSSSLPVHPDAMPQRTDGVGRFARGYTTFSIDYRLTDIATDNGVWPEPEQDVKAAIQFTRLAGSTLGTNQVVVQGHSAGARLGGVVLTTPDDVAFQRAQLWTAVSDAADGFIGFYGYYDGFQFEWDAYYGKGVDSPAQARASATPVRPQGRRCSSRATPTAWSIPPSPETRPPRSTRPAATAPSSSSTAASTASTRRISSSPKTATP